jgi:hypothetical protein
VFGAKKGFDVHDGYLSRLYKMALPSG